MYSSVIDLQSLHDRLNCVCECGDGDDDVAGMMTTTHSDFHRSAACDDDDDVYDYDDDYQTMISCLSST